MDAKLLPWHAAPEISQGKRLFAEPYRECSRHRALHLHLLRNRKNRAGHFRSDASHDLYDTSMDDLLGFSRRSVRPAAFGDPRQPVRTAVRRKGTLSERGRAGSLFRGTPASRILPLCQARRAPAVLNRCATAAARSTVAPQLKPNMRLYPLDRAADSDSGWRGLARHDWVTKRCHPIFLKYSCGFRALGDKIRQTFYRRCPTSKPQLNPPQRGFRLIFQVGSPAFTFPPFFPVVGSAKVSGSFIDRLTNPQNGRILSPQDPRGNAPFFRTPRLDGQGVLTL